MNYLVSVQVLESDTYLKENMLDIRLSEWLEVSKLKLLLEIACRHIFHHEAVQVVG